MKIKILNEALARNKKMINYLSGKWKLESPELTNNEIIDILTRFDQVKDGLSTKKPQVQSFLYRFNGSFNEKFDPQNLKSVEKYTLEQIKSLLSEYSTDPYIGDEDINYTESNSKSTPQRVENSMRLWYGENNKVFDSGDGLRVYKIKNQKVSMAYGFYVQHINKLQRSSSTYWCVTWRPDEGSNRWETYRDMGKTFYFIIDEKRDKDSDKFYLSALQILDNNKNTVVLTSVRNDGDTSYTLEELFKIYPSLQGNMDLFPSVGFTKEELSIKNKIALINETIGDENEFRRQERPVKLTYINQGNPITKAISWESMDQGLRSTYITLTNENNYIERFSNIELIRAVKKSKSDITLLSNNNITLGMLMSKYMRDTFKTGRVSIDNPNVILYKNKRTEKYCIYHANYEDFYRLGNVYYDEGYNEIDSTIYQDEEGNDYIVETFSKTETENPESFHVITPVRDNNPKGTAHFLSNNSWKSLLNKLTVKQDDDFPIKDMPDFKPDTDTDIKEKMEV